MRIQSLNRRTLLKTAGTAVVASNMSVIDGLSQPSLASELAQQGKSVILLWLAGGASQLETWDPKPGRRTGGPYSKIKTSVPGIEISELLPKMSSRLGETAIIRSLNTKIADHGQGYTLMDTGRIPEPGVRFPHLGAIIAHELGQIDSRVDAELEVGLDDVARDVVVAAALAERRGQALVVAPLEARAIHLLVRHRAHGVRFRRWMDFVSGERTRRGRRLSASARRRGLHNNRCRDVRHDT